MKKLKKKGLKKGARQSFKHDGAVFTLINFAKGWRIYENAETGQRIKCKADVVEYL
jgi:hypothetical protein